MSYRVINHVVFCEYCHLCAHLAISEIVFFDLSPYSYRTDVVTLFSVYFAGLWTLHGLDFHQVSQPSLRLLTLLMAVAKTISSFAIVKCDPCGCLHL